MTRYIIELGSINGENVEFNYLSHIDKGSESVLISTFPDNIQIGEVYECVLKNGKYTDFKKLSISDLNGEVDSVQSNPKLTVYTQKLREIAANRMKKHFNENKALDSEDAFKTIKEAKRALEKSN